MDVEQHQWGTAVSGVPTRKQGCRNEVYEHTLIKGNFALVVQ